jgi:hypothetical protein
MLIKKKKRFQNHGKETSSFSNATKKKKKKMDTTAIIIVLGKVIEPAKSFFRSSRPERDSKTGATTYVGSEGKMSNW